MPRTKNPKKPQPLNITRIFFYVLYLIITVFVSIGEATKFVLLLPFRLIGMAIKPIISYFKGLQLPKAPKTYTPLTAENTTKSQKSESKSKKNVPGLPPIWLNITKQLKARYQAINFSSIKLGFIWNLIVKTVKFIGFLIRSLFRFIFTVLWKTTYYIVISIIWVIRLPYRIFIALFSVRFRFFLFGFLVCLLVVGVYASYNFVQQLPNPRDIGKRNYPLSTHIYDRNNKLLYEVYHDQNRTPVSLKDLPKYVPQASIAIEDKDFYKHNGVSFVSGVLRAARETVLKNNLQGGSTITQQLVKGALLTPERTWQRKVKEMILAIQTEQVFSKDQILEMYLNQVPYGGTAFGVEEASKTYFGKSAKDLTIAEAALLAGLPQAPSVYSPFVNPQYAINRRNEVINKMYEQGYITNSERDVALGTPLSIISSDTNIKAPHFVFYVRNELENMYGTSQVEEGGLKVKTTIDLDIQAKAEQILKEELEKIKNLNVTNGGILVTRPGSGEILAMVGSVDYNAKPFGAYNVTTGLRQPGSSMKPFIYAMAMERGYTAATVIDDNPTAFTISSTEVYRPVNYDGKFHGPVPLRYALANSFNIPAVKTVQAFGVPNFVNYAQRMGITTWQDPSKYGLSIALGGAEVHMTDAATAYGVFANQGYKVPVTGISQIDDAYGNELYTLSPTKTRVMNPGVAYIMSDILSDPFARVMEFGTNSALEIPGIKASVKTGTTDNKKDNWADGYTPDFVVIVWVGNNDNTPMNQALASGITGAAPIWHRMMEYLVRTYGNPNKWYDMPNDVVAKTCYFGKQEYFLRGTENSANCSGPKPTQPPVANITGVNTLTNSNGPVYRSVQ